MEKMVYMWLLGIIVLAAFEAISLSLTTVWPLFGCIVALVFEVCGAPLWAQLIAFIISTTLLYAATRPIINKYFKLGQQKTNIDALVGEKCVVISDISNIEGKGQIKLKGQVWSARSETGEDFKAGDLVKAVRLAGVCIYVTAWQPEEQSEQPDKE